MHETLMKTLTLFFCAGNFLPFGMAAGDSLLSDVLDGASPAQVRMNSSCSIFGSDEDAIYVNCSNVKVK